MILVTGAGGFLGQSVCVHLRGEKLAHITADLRAPDPCDITDRQAVDRLFETHRPEIVIHLAAMLPSACRANPREATRVNIIGSANLIDAAAEYRVKRFVFGSSVSARGSDVYGTGKRYVEVYGQTCAATHGTSFVALRLATVVGPGARQTASPWRSEIFEKLGTGSRQRITLPFGAGTMLSLVHVEDAARMLALLATRPDVPSQIYDSPSEDWYVRDLKQLIESLDDNVTVELDPASLPGKPLLADGAAFLRDFLWCAPRLKDRLAGSLRK